LHFRRRHYADAAFVGYIAFGLSASAIAAAFFPAARDLASALLVLDLVALWLAAVCIAAGVALWRIARSSFGLGVALGFLTVFVIWAAALGLLKAPGAAEATKIPVNIPASIAAAAALILPGRSVVRFVLPICILVGIVAYVLGRLIASDLSQMNQYAAYAATLVLIGLPLAVLTYVYIVRPNGVVGGMLVFTALSLLHLPASPASRPELFAALVNVVAYGAIPFGLVVDGLAALRLAHVDPSASGNDPTRRDALTGLFNRRTLDTAGETLLAETLGFGRPVSVLMMDLDHFKMVNDVHGHAAGDAVLQQFAGILTANVRSTDLVARYGGEEFVAVLPGASLAVALRLAERIRREAEQARFGIDDKHLAVTVSIGVASVFPGDSAALRNVIAIADRNLYRAKRAGRNRVMANPVIDPQDEA
jgi:diguanylate cyclase (GGDEF)-like protein